MVAAGRMRRGSAASEAQRRSPPRTGGVYEACGGKMKPASARRISEADGPDVARRAPARGKAPGYAGANAPALAEIAEKFAEAIDRGLWTPRSNSARARIETLRHGT